MRVITGSGAGARAGSPSGVVEATRSLDWQTLSSRKLRPVASAPITDGVLVMTAN